APGRQALGRAAAAAPAQVEPGAAGQLLELHAAQLRLRLRLAQLAGQQPAQDAPHRPLSETQSSRSRGPSNSQRKTACQRPSSSWPAITGRVALAPTSIALTCASELPSEWVKGRSRGTSSRAIWMASACTAGSQPSLTVTAQ